MKKRLMASLLAVCLLVSMIPTWAMAADPLTALETGFVVYRDKEADSWSGGMSATLSSTTKNYWIETIYTKALGADYEKYSDLDIRYFVSTVFNDFVSFDQSLFPAALNDAVNHFGRNSVKNGTTTYETERVQIYNGRDLLVNEFKVRIQGYVNVNWVDEDGKTLASNVKVDVGDTLETAKAAAETAAAAAADAKDDAQYDYSFDGWVEDVPAGAITTTNAANVDGATYTAKYKRDVKEYTVTWNDESGNLLYSEQVAYGETPAYDASRGGDVSKDGYALSWKDDSGSGITSVTGDVTYTASYAVSEFTVTWNVDGAETKVGYAYGEEIVLPTEPTKEGHTFASWTGYTAGMTMPANDVTFTATWTVNKYEITFVDEDGTTELYSVEVEYNANPVYQGAEPSKAGWNFRGWTDGTDVYNGTLPAVTGEATYKAVYTQTPTYTVTYANTDLQPDTLEEGTQITKPADDPVQADNPNTGAKYTFLGWYADEDLTKEYVFDTPITDDVTIYADWKVEYPVTFVVDGRTYDSGYYEEGAAIALPDEPTKTGHSFGGWNGYNEGMTMPAQSVTFTAVWDVEKHTVTWTVDGVSTSKDYEYGAQIEVPADPEKEGYTFVGWDNLIPATMPDSDLEFVAVWRINSYNVTWDVDGNETVIPYDYNAPVAKAADPKKDGAVFLGWDVDGDGDADKIVEKMPAEDVTYVALWKDMSITAEDGSMTSDDIADAADAADLTALIQDRTELGTYPETIKGGVKTLYLARPAGTKVSIPLPAKYANLEETFSSIGVTFPYEVTLPAQWLTVGETIPNVLPETALSKVIDGVMDNSIGMSTDAIKEALIKELTYTACLTFGANPDGLEEYTEQVKYTYLDGEKTIESAAVTVTIKESRVNTSIYAEDIEVVYGQYTTEEQYLEAMKAAVMAEGAEIDGEITFSRQVVGLAASDKAYEVTLNYAGENKYLASSKVVHITVKKAVASVSVDSQAVKYTGAPVADPITANCETIDFIVGIDAHDETYIVGSAQVAVPEVIYNGIDTYFDYDLNDLTIEEVKELLKQSDALGNSQLTAGVEALKEYSSQLNKLVDAMEKIQAKLPMDTELKISIVKELVIPSNVGLYVVGTIVSDNNYAAPSQEESMDAGYLIITPDGMKATLAWDENDDNYIVTIGKLDSFNFGAHVESVNEGTVAEAESQLDYLFIGVDDDGELLIDRVKNGYGEDVSKVLTQVGVYAQVAYISNWGNTMYYAEPIVRPVLVTPDVANVTIHDASGSENYAQVYTYGDSIDVTVKVDGVAAPVENLRYKWIGSDTTIDGWYRNEAPTDAGVYTLVALYTEKDAEGDLAKAGGAVAVVIIEPADAEVGLNDTTVCPDGAEHFAELTNEALDYITVAIDRENNIAYINIPEDTTAHAERIVTMLPAEIEAKVMEMLNTYASAMEEKVPTSAVKAELNKILDELIAIDLTAEGKAAAEATIEKLKAAVENSEDVKALIAEIKAKVEALESKIRDEIPDNYETKIEEYIRDIVTVTEDNVDIDIDKVKADIKQLAAELEAEGGLPLAVAGVLYKVVDELETALKNNATVNEMTDKVKEIIAELKALDMADAEEIVTKAVGALAGKVDTTELKELVSEVIAKFEALGYVEYTVDLLKDIAGMYKGDLDVDSYVAAVESELNALVDTVKAKVKSGDLQKDDLEAVETYIDNILGKLKVLVDKIPDGTLVFGQNPSEVGEYDCYAMNISANYKPEFVEAKLTIGHVLVEVDEIPATCEDEGTAAHYECENCGKLFEDEEATLEITADDLVIDALGHDYDDGVETTPATCDKDGVKTFTCQNDKSHTYTEPIPAIGHSFTKYESDNNATCTEDGTKTAECDNGCGKTDTVADEGSALGHDYDDGVETTPATCDKDGVKTFTCQNDKTHTYTEPIPATGHAWGPWVTVKQPSYTEEGLMQRVCANDPRHIETQTIAKLVAYQPTVSVKLPMVKNLNYMDHVAYIIGYADGTVDPTGTITRAEVATIYFRLMTDAAREKYWSNTNSFADVADTAWYNVAVSTLANAGVIVDCFDGNFRPNDYITRAELAVLAAQFCSVSVTDVKSTFADVADNYWAADEIALVQRIGWIEGYNGLYRPDDTITRAETMTIINRMLHRGAEAHSMLNGMKVFSDNLPTAWYYEAVQEATNSHSYIRTSVYLTGEDFYGERWTAIQAAPDWAALEKAWADANK